MGSFVQKIKQALASLGVVIENGIVKIKELVVDRFTTKTARVEKIEMIDAVTGDTYCTWIERGEMKKVKTECNKIEYLNGQIVISGLSSIYGCSNPDALNYNSNVNVDDGSCEYEEENQESGIMNQEEEPQREEPQSEEEPQTEPHSSGTEELEEEEEE